MDTVLLRRWFLAALFPLLGCGLSAVQRGAVTEFSRATATLGATTSAELLRMRAKTIDMNERRLRLGAPTADQPDHTDLDENFDPAVVLVRMQAAEAVQDFGVLLLALVEASEEKPLEEASDRFVQSVRRLGSENRRLSDEQLEAVGKAVQAVGGLIVEAKRARAVKEIVGSSREQVARLLELLEGDLDPGANRLATQYLLTTERLLVAADGGLEGARPQAVEAMRLGMEERNRRDAVLAPAAQAVGRMRAAHARLAEVLEHDEVSLDDVRAFGASVRGLADAARMLR